MNMIYDNKKCFENLNILILVGYLKDLSSWENDILGSSLV